MKQATNIIEALEAGLLTRSAAETEAVGHKLAGVLPEGEIVLALCGPLGSGKSTLVRGLARGLGIQDSITSPTFNLYARYRGQRNLIHLDAYRLESARALDPLMLEEFLEAPWCLAVEWPENIAEWIPESAWWIHYGSPSSDERTLTLKRP